MLQEGKMKKSCKATKSELRALDEVLDYTSSIIDPSVAEERQLERAVDKVIKLRNKIGKC